MWVIFFDGLNKYVKIKTVFQISASSLKKNKIKKNAHPQLT